MKTNYPREGCIPVIAAYVWYPRHRNTNVLPKAEWIKVEGHSALRKEGILFATTWGYHAGISQRKTKTVYLNKPNS